MSIYTYIHENRTPNGNPFKLNCRLETNDQNVAHSVSKLDEYGLRGRELEGWAVDIGASVGGVAIPLAIDHPDLTVVAVEPIPENVLLLQRSIVLNDVADRVLVCPLAAASPGNDLVPIRYGGSGIYRFVGNAGEVEADAGEFDAPGISLADLLIFYQIDEVALLKIDCEGCEWSVLAEKAVSRCRLIVGEFHETTQEYGAKRVRILLERTHRVTIERWAFTAERR